MKWVELLRKSIYVLLVGVLLVAPVGGGVFAQEFTDTSLNLTSEEIITIFTPSLARVIVHVSGQVEVVPFTLDAEELTVQKAGFLTNSSVVDIDDYLMGEGVFISTEGYVLTSAHLVSEEAVKLAVVVPIVKQAVSEAFSAVGQVEIAPQQAIEYSARIVDFVLQNSTFTITIEPAIINPNQSEYLDGSQGLDLLFQEALPTEVSYVHEEFILDGLSVAVLQSDISTGIPIAIAENRTLAKGDVVYTFAHPSHKKSITDGAYTTALVKGIVTGIPEDSSFYFVNMGFAPEGFEGVVVDEQGQVVGLAAYEESHASGPYRVMGLDVIAPMVGQLGIPITTGDGGYRGNIIGGIQSLHDLKCEDAKTYFSEILLGGELFISAQQNFDGWVDACNKNTVDIRVENKELTRDIEKESQYMNAIKDQLDKLPIDAIMDNPLLLAVFALALIVVIITVWVIVRVSVNKRSEEKYYQEEEDRRRRVKNIKRSGDDVTQKAFLSTGKRTMSKDITIKQEDTPDAKKKKKEIDFGVPPEKPKEVDSTDSDSIDGTKRKKGPVHIPVEEVGDSNPSDEIVLPGQEKKDGDNTPAELWPSKYSVESVEANLKEQNKEMLSTYIAHTIDKGFSDLEIRDELQKVGWDSTIIDGAFALYSKEVDNESEKVEVAEELVVSENKSAVSSAEESIEDTKEKIPEDQSEKKNTTAVEDAPDQTLVAYIKDARAAKMKDEEIKEELMHTGWLAAKVNRAFEASKK